MLPDTSTVHRSNFTHKLWSPKWGAQSPRFPVQCQTYESSFSCYLCVFFKVHNLHQIPVCVCVCVFLFVCVSVCYNFWKKMGPYFLLLNFPPFSFLPLHSSQDVTLSLGPNCGCEISSLSLYSLPTRNFSAPEKFVFHSFLSLGDNPSLLSIWTQSWERDCIISNFPLHCITGKRKIKPMWCKIHSNTGIVMGKVCLWLLSLAALPLGGWTLHRIFFFLLHSFLL